MKRVFAGLLITGALLLVGCRSVSAMVVATATSAASAEHGPRTSPTVAAPSATPIPTSTALLPVTRTLTPTLAPTPTLAALPPVNTANALAPEAQVITVANTHQLSRIARLGTGTARSAAWSPNGRFFIVESSLGLYVYDARTWAAVTLIEGSGRFEWSPSGHYLAVQSRLDSGVYGVVVYDGVAYEPVKEIDQGLVFAWSGAGDWLAVIGQSEVFLFDATDLQLVRSINTGAAVRKVSFSPDGGTLATLDDQVRLWATATGGLLKTFAETFEGTLNPSSFHFNAAGTAFLLLTTDDEGFDIYLNLWDVASGRSLFEQRGFIEYRNAVAAAWSPDGGQVAVLVYQTLRILKAQSGTVLQTITLPGIEEYINGPVRVAYAAGGSTLLTTAGLYNAQSGQPISRRGYARFELTKDGRWFLYESALTSERGPGIEIRAASDNRPVARVPGECDWMRCAAMDPAGQQVASLQGGQVLVHSLTSGEQLAEFQFSPAAPRELVLGGSPQGTAGSVLAASAGDLWAITPGQPVTTLGSVPEGAVALRVDGRLLAYPGTNGEIQIVDMLSRQALRSFSGGQLAVSRLAFSPNGNLLVGGLVEPGTGAEPCYNELSYWEVTTGALVGALQQWSCGFAFGPEADQLAWSLGNEIHVVNMRTGVAVGDFIKPQPGPEEGYLALGLSADGRWLAAGTSTGLIDIWDVTSGQLAHSLDGHGTVYRGRDLIPAGDVLRIAFSPQGTVFASVGLDCSVGVWEAESGQLLRRLPGVCGSVAFAPDGTLLAASASDGTIHVFGIADAN